MKKILMLSILAMLVFVVSACGGNNPVSVPQQQPTPPTTTQTTPPTGTADNSTADVAALFEVDPAFYAEGQRLWEEFYELATAMAYAIANSNDTDVFFMTFRAWVDMHGEWFEQFTSGEFADFEALSYFERFLWTDTYLRMVEAMYNSTYIETADRFRQFTIGAQTTAINRQCEETAAAYEALMMWQYDYLMASHTVFNFITGVNHRDSIGADFDPIAASAERDAAEQALIEQELQEIADEIDEP